MDSLTQAVLGAGVGLALLGRRAGPRRVALIGTVLGTLPDLDVLVPFANPVDDMVLHRGASHSLLVHAAITPFLGEVIRQLVRELRDSRWLTWLTVFACLATHALLDAMTVYGTQLFWPLTSYPFGLGSVFIIDPLYTLPLLVVTLWALLARGWSRPLGRATATALVLSTAYLGWSAVGQHLALARAEAALVGAGLTAERTLATPTPFNTLFWRVIALDGERYHNVYVPLLGEGVALESHARGPVCVLAHLPEAQRLAAFSKGFFRVEQLGDRLAVADLRMGLTPAYVFRFVVAAVGPDGPVPVVPVRLPTRRELAHDRAWLLAGIAGAARSRPTEDGAIRFADAVRHAVC
jgi:inner membrane protein